MKAWRIFLSLVDGLSPVLHQISTPEGKRLVGRLSL